MTAFPQILPSTRLAIQATAAVGLAISLVDLVGIERPYWVMLTAVVVMVGSIGETLSKSIDRTAGTLFGLATGIIIYAAAEWISFPTIILLAMATATMVFFVFVNYRLMVVALSIMLVILFRLGGADDMLLLVRLYDTAIGALIAGVVSIVVLPIPTRRPALATIATYVDDLKTTIHDAIDAIIKGEWSGAIDDNAERLRRSETNFTALANALRAESVVFGGHGRNARQALAVLPVLRGYVDAIVEAAKPAADCGLGQHVADQLSGIDRAIATNLDVLRTVCTGESTSQLAVLDRYMEEIEAQLSPKLLAPPLTDGAEARRDVMTLQNALLTLRRFNQGIRHTVEFVK